MEAEFIVSAIVPTPDGKEEICLRPRSEDAPRELARSWVMRIPHGLKVGEVVKVGRWSSQS